MHEAKVIVLVGMPGAGKSFLVDYLVDKGFPKVYFGGVVVNEAKRRFGVIDEKHEKIVREDLRNKEGKGAIAKRILTQIDELIAQGHNQIVADGLYSWTEYKIFKERWGEHAHIIAVAAPRKLRHERLAQRHVRPLTDEEVTAREFAEIENLEKGGPIANADYTIVNEGTSEQLIADFDKILKTIGFQT